MKLCRICFCCKHCTSVVMLCCFDLFVIQTSIAQIYNAPGLEIYRFFPCYVHFHLNFCSYMFFLCTLCVCRFALSAIPRLGPGIAACSYIYYYYYYYYYYSSSLPMGVYGSPMNGTWENDEIWHTLRYGHK